MKKSSVGSIALFVIFALSGVYCDSPDSNFSCIENYNKCIRNSDCCSKKCLSSVGFLKHRLCVRPNDTDTAIDPIKIEKGMCSYYKPKDEEFHQAQVRSFGLFASHPLLPINSMVEVEHNHKKVMVLISNQIVEHKNNSILEVSREAAKELGVETEGLFDCSLELIVTDEDYYPLLKPIGVIVLYVVAMFLFV